MTVEELAHAAVFEHGAAQKEQELYGLIEFLRSRSPLSPLRRVIEIGCQDCGTLWLWSQLATDDAVIVGLDVGFRSPVAHARAQQQTTLIEADSHLDITRSHVASIVDVDIDLLFIDGDHTFAGVNRDWDLYSPLVRPGGLVVLHDIYQHSTPEFSEVRQLWTLLCTTHA